MNKFTKSFGLLRQIYANHTRKFGDVNLLSYAVAIVPRILFVMHAVFSIRLLDKYVKYENIQTSSDSKLEVIWQPTAIKIVPIYTGLILLVFESLYTILARKGHEYKHIWFSGFFYLVTQIPVICCLEYAFFQKRRAYYELTTNQEPANQTTPFYTKAPYVPDTFLNCFHLGLEFNCTDKFIKNFAELGLISVIIIGRWMLPRGELTRDQLSALLIGYVNTAADLTEFIGLHSKPSISQERTVTIVVLALYSISLLQFVVVTTSTTYEYSETEKEVIQSLSANLSHNRLRRYMQPAAVKMGRSQMLRNVDALTKNAFRSGRRGGERRRGILTASDISKVPTSSVAKAQNQVSQTNVANETIYEDSETQGSIEKRNSVILRRSNDSNKIEENNEFDVKEDIDEFPEKESDTNVTVNKISNARFSTLQKWQTSAPASLRLEGLRRSLVEENWKELSQMLRDMKLSKRREVGSREDLFIPALLAKSNQVDEKANDIEVEEREDEDDEEEDDRSPWHRWLEVVQTEMGGLLIALFLQEIPFFFTRVAFIYQYKVFDRGLIFYTTKNFFMLCFLNYRLWVATTEE